MKRRVQTYVLTGLLLLLASLFLRGFQDSQQVVTAQSNQTFTPMDVHNPALRVTDIDETRKRVYEGSGRNIFDYGADKRTAKGPENPPPVEPQQPPEPQAPKGPVPSFKFYGLTTNQVNGRRRAFFTNGDDIWIAEEGQMIDRRFRLVKIGNTFAEVEEVSSGQKVMLQLEEPPVG